MKITVFFTSPLILLVTSLLWSTQTHARIDTTWSFNGDLSASTGTATMSYRGNMLTNVQFFASEHIIGLPMPFGDNSGLIQFGATDPSQGLTINLNNGGATVSDYTMVWDYFRPAPSWDSWMSLYQTDLSNTNDGELFINPFNDGIGINGDFAGKVADGVGNIGWNRIAVTRAVDGTMKKYIDGQLVGTQVEATGPSSRWDINGSFLLFADENNETSGGYLSSFRFVDSVLNQSTIAALGGVHADGANVDGQGLVGDPAEMTLGSFTIAILGDTQIYSQSFPDIFNTMTQWLVDNKVSRNIQFVVQDGDIVNSADVSSQWDNARAALDTLNEEIPYAVVRGNHDINSPYDSPSRFGPGSPYSQQPTIAGWYRYPGQPDWDMRNTYHIFEVGSQKFLVLTVDISANSNVVAWANQVVTNNPNRRVIINTHSYMYDGGQRFDASLDPNDSLGRTRDQVRDELLRVAGDEISSQFNARAYNGQDAEELWSAFVSQHENIRLVIAGHQFEDFDRFKYRLSEGVNGNKIFQMLVNQQHFSNGGNGWIRLLEFDSDGETVRVKTYSPFLDQWDTSPDVYHNIEFKLPVVDLIWQSGFEEIEN
ncbi:MAG: metallophosphoesterase [Proteobacteria bacterium]|nr:metallophosphoesterase [Pseudomonadota bacterium]